MKRIIISRTDAIGDVVLTLPLAGIIKEKTGAEIIFFGRDYTKPLIAFSRYVDRFISYDDFQKKDKKGKTDFLKSLHADAIIHVYPRSDIAFAAMHARIPLRIGTSHRLYHWFSCNSLLSIGRKNSPLHEAQLNCRLLEGLKLKSDYSLQELSHYYGLNISTQPNTGVQDLLDKEKFNLVLHPHSHGSGREWGLDNYRGLILLLPENRYQVFITGSEKEKEKLSGWIQTLPSSVHDLTGKFSLEELIAFINAADGLVACSTGPLHIGAASGKHALGIYPPIRPMHAGRWAPVGKKAQFISSEKQCSHCRTAPETCTCIREVTPEAVMHVILQWRKDEK